MAGVEEYGSELADFRRRVEELKSARALPQSEPMSALDAALFELQHAADVLWPRYVQLLAATGRHGGEHPDTREQQLLRALFQRLPMPVVLLDRDGVVRRLNVAASELFAIRPGYASGRALTGALAHGVRAAFRSQVAAVARGEGARSLRVRLLRAPDPESPASAELRATLTPLRPPREQRAAVLAVFQLAAQNPPSPVTRPPGDADGEVSVYGEPEHSDVAVRLPALSEMTRHAELLDLVDDMAAELLVAASAQEAAERAAAVLQGRFADWVVVDTRAEAGAPLRRAAVRVSCAADPAVREAVAAQDPSRVPLVVDAVERGREALQVRPEAPGALGQDASGAPVLVRTEASSLICVPLEPPAGPALGALTLLRAGGRRPFAMVEAGSVSRMARHLALALHRWS
ncbi:PAS domain-containing protein [Streptomyces sp. NPDC048172]|uniref:PAS domain-containing protein n=1 Tax=Streptomyces sp. NPDC048172 TaxID=3365505 RepID=UPI00371894DA